MVLLAGGRELPMERYRETGLIELFDLKTKSWMRNYDVDGSFQRRIGHSIATMNQKVYLFGGETTENCIEPRQTLNDFYEISFDGVSVHIRRIMENEEVPSARSWHASVAVKYAATPEVPHEDALMVLGGSDRSRIFSDVWLMVNERVGEPEGEEVDGKPSPPRPVVKKWMRLLTTGTSPLPVTCHSCFALGEGDKVLVLGGKQPNNQILSGVHVLDLTTSVWSVLATFAAPIHPRCCTSSCIVSLPFDEATKEIMPVRAQTRDVVESKKKDFVVIYGGFSIAEPHLDTSLVLFDLQSNLLHEIATPQLGIKSYMGHASVASSDRQSMFFFGGIDAYTNDFVESVHVLHFWKEQITLDSEEQVLELAVMPDKAPTRLESASGDVYIGEVTGNGVRHGTGQCTFANGDVYDGDWVDDKRHGRGTMQYANGDSYRGDWQDNVRHGQGVLEFTMAANASSHGTPAPRVATLFDGQWARDLQHGQGKLHYSDGSVVQGEWQDGQFVAQQNARIDDFMDDSPHGGVGTFVGHVVHGVPHGHGEFTCKGEKYTGNWQNGKRHGQGKCSYADGTTFEGEWRNSKRNGFGTCFYAKTREVYKGKWVGDQRCGKGICTLPSGCEYNGQWLNDVRHGLGRFTFADKKTFYQGNWQEDAFCGDGTLAFDRSCSDMTTSAVSQPSTPSAPQDSTTPK